MPNLRIKLLFSIAEYGLCYLSNRRITDILPYNFALISDSANRDSTTRSSKSDERLNNIFRFTSRKFLFELFRFSPLGKIIVIKKIVFFIAVRSHSNNLRLLLTPERASQLSRFFSTYFLQRKFAHFCPSIHFMRKLIPYPQTL